MSEIRKENPVKSSLGAFGKKNPKWKGGRCIRKDEKNDSLYQHWVNKIKRRDNWFCKMHNKNCFGYCIAHHILSWKDNLELRYDVNNGITLCQAHHPRRRIEEKRLIPVFQELILRGGTNFEVSDPIVQSLTDY